MNSHPWSQGFPGAITVTDADGTILEMNDKSAQAFIEDGGTELIGKNVFDCHPELARSKLREMYKTHQINVYTIEKNGQKKFIYQSPWYTEGKFSGYVELSIEIPFDLPLFIRD